MQSPIHRLPTTLAVVLGAVLLASCGGQPGPSSSGSTPLAVSRFPPVNDGSGGACAGPPPSPPTLAQALTGMRVVIGRVSKVAGVVAPAWVEAAGANPPWVSVAQCTGQVQGAIQVKLTNVRTLWGPEVTTSTLQVGDRWLEQWGKAPSFTYVDVKGSVHWTKGTGVVVGSEIGLVGILEPGRGLLTPYDSPFFSVDAQGVVHVQSGTGEPCGGGASVYAPLDGLTVPALKRLLGDLATANPAAAALGEPKTFKPADGDLWYEAWGAPLCYP